jgi:hypothetical protein
VTTPTCSKCNRVIPSDDLNVADDVAYCRVCNLSHKLSSLAQAAELGAGVDLGKPPTRAWCRNERSESVIGATHRSVGWATGLLAFSLCWNGIVSVFVLLAIASTLRNAHIPLPSWLPAPVMNHRPISVGDTIFLWLFLTPFIVTGLAIIGGLLSCLAGRTEVRLGHSDAVVFSGVGSLGCRRRFNPRTVKVVRIADRQRHGNYRSKRQIVIESLDGEQIKFGTMLSDARRKFVAAAVRKELRR